MLAHIKIRLCRIKGLKDCHTFSAENGLRSPGNKGREFFYPHIMAVPANTR